MSLSESALKKLSKDEVLLRNKEISDLRQNYEKIQSEFCVSRIASSKLTVQIVLLERQCWSNFQYSRRECLELSGLHESIKNSELEDTALQLFKELDVEKKLFQH